MKIFIILICLSFSTSVLAQNKDKLIEELKTQLAEKERIIKAQQEEIKKINGELQDLQEIQVVEAADEEATEFQEGKFPWSNNMNRIPQGVLSPFSSTIPEGKFYGRFSHVARTPLNHGDEAFHNMLGFEDDVTVGIMVGYGLSENWDVTLQRTTGRDYFKDFFSGEEFSYDLWELMTKVKILDQEENYIDLALTGGTTVFLEDEVGDSEKSLNLGVIVEKSFWEDRIRLGSGLLYSSLSDFRTVAGDAYDGRTASKRHREEIEIDNSLFQSNGPDHTLAVPLNVAFAINKKHQLYAESVFPIDGYDTDNGPSLTLGYRINTSTHAYNLFLSNTPNGSFNSTITGGYDDSRLNIFGFNVSIFY